VVLILLLPVLRARERVLALVLVLLVQALELALE
jgi:hypothetical protein